MICNTSEAICETAGSMMNQHGGKNCHLSPKYFSMELYLKFNLGPKKEAKLRFPADFWLNTTK